jgi:hypothetical protein
VVHEHHRGPRLGRTREQLAVRAHAGRDHLDLLAARHLEPVRAVVVERPRVEQLVEEGDDLVAAGHAGTVVDA